MSSVTRELFEIRAEIKSLQEREKELREDLLAENNHQDGTWSEGYFLVEVRPNRRFNPNKAVKVLGEDALKPCFKQVLDSVKVKALFGDRYEDFQDEVGKVVTIKFDEENI